MKTIMFLSLIALSFNACADSFSSPPQCYKPNKPIMFSPAYYIDRYNKDVIEYKQCINDFINEQKKAISSHKESIKQARQLLTKHKKASSAAFTSF